MHPAAAVAARECAIRPASCLRLACLADIYVNSELGQMLRLGNVTEAPPSPPVDGKHFPKSRLFSTLRLLWNLKCGDLLELR
jgi:hypothetical protein